MTRSGEGSATPSCVLVRAWPVTFSVPAGRMEYGCTTDEVTMGLLENLRFAVQRRRGQAGRSCRHLDQIRDVRPEATGCQSCLALGDSWVHLRMCMTDGEVLRYDYSKNKHASGHAREHAPMHQIVRGAGPGPGIAHQPHHG